MDELLTTVLLPAVVIAVMFTMGLALVLDDFRVLARRPLPIAVGLLCQLVLLPAVGFAVAAAFPLEPVFAAGIVLIAACPGGSFANLLIHVADGDRALSVSLTAFSGVVTIVTIPLLVDLGLHTFTHGDAAFSLPLGQAFLQVAGLAVLPVVVGMAFRHWRPVRAEWLLRVSHWPTVAAMGLVVAAIVAREWDVVTEHGLEVGPAVLTLNVAALAVGYLLPLAFGLGMRQRIAISIGTGIQNAPLAIAIAITVIGSEELAVPAGLFGLFMLVTASGFAAGLRRLQAGAEPVTT